MSNSNRDPDTGRYAYGEPNPLRDALLAAAAAKQADPVNLAPQAPDDAVSTATYDLNDLLRLITSGKATPVLRPVIDGTAQPTPDDLLRQLATITQD